MITDITSNMNYHPPSSSSSSQTVVLHKRAHHNTFGVYVGEDIPSGIYVVTVEPNSPATEANVQPGDRILAINGQLVSSMHNDPKEMMIQAARNSQSLTLAIQRSSIFETLNLPVPNQMTHNNYPYPSSAHQTGTIDDNLERYIKSIFVNENLHVVPSSSSDANEYILTSDPYPSHLHHHHQDQKKSHRKKKQRPAVNHNAEKENHQPLSSQRSIPSMGTPHVMLRNSQTSSKGNETQESTQYTGPNVTTNNNQGFGVQQANAMTQPAPTPQRGAPPPAAQPAPTPQRGAPPTTEPAPTPQRGAPPPAQPAPTPQRGPATLAAPTPERGAATQPTHAANPPPALETNKTPETANDGLRKLHLRHSPDFKGYGFHIQFNKLHYLVQSVVVNSPAEVGGLRGNDIILEINNEKTEKMPHATLVQIVDSNTELTFLVQNFDAYLRANPEVSRTRPNAATLNALGSGDKSDATKPRTGVLSKALNKISTR